MRCNLAGSVPNNPSKCQSEKKLIGHLRSQTGGVVHRRFPHHPPRGAPNQPQYFHRAQVYFALRNYPLNSPAPFPS